MRPETLLLLQAAGAGALLAFGVGASAAWAAQRDAAGTAWTCVLPGALAAVAATALMLRGWRRAGALASGWPATRMAAWIVLHLLWLLPLLVGVAILVLPPIAGAQLGGIDIGAWVVMFLMIAAVGSAVAWGLPAYFLALLGCRGFLARTLRASEQKA